MSDKGELVRFAEWHARLAKKLPNGGNVRDALISAERQTGTKHEILSSPILSPKNKKIWRWFQELRGFQFEEDGTGRPLSWSDLSGWAAVMNRRPDAGEIALLFELDRALRKTSSQNAVFNVSTPNAGSFRLRQRTI